MISTLKSRLPVSALLEWEDFFRTREASSRNLCTGCKNFLVPLIGFKIKKAAPDASTKQKKKDKLVNDLREHRLSGSCSQVVLF